MLVLDNISFSYPTESYSTRNSRALQNVENDAPVQNLKHISLQLEQGTHLALMGESGCGKTTLLKYIYGLLEYSTGKVLWDGIALGGAQDHLVPGHTMMKYVPQEFDLMPFTTVYENVGEHISMQKDNRRDRINMLLGVVDIVSLANRKVKTLSGGQKQRVAIARALAKEPQLLLLDEPFSHIDRFRRSDLRRRLFKYLRSKNISSIMATHDREDVLGFTEQLLVLKDGSSVAQGNTVDLYANPTDRYMGTLFDEVNELDQPHTNQNNLYYPHQLEFLDKGLSVTIKTSYFQGSHYLIECIDKAGKLYFLNSTKALPKDMQVSIAVRL